MEPNANPNKQLWEKGDFTRIAATMRGAGEEMVSKLGISAGMKVLDLGCGDGTTALPEAALGAEVLGVDIAANLVAAGNARAAAAGLANCRFAEGDAADLTGLGDGDFDLVVSMFGAMFAPRPDDVAKEMVRVCAPGGRIVMGNWIPGDPTLVAQILGISGQFTPPPPAGFVSPMTWGDEATVARRFGDAGIEPNGVAFSRESWMFDFPGPASELLATFRDYYGPTMNAYAAAQGAGRGDELHEQMEALFQRCNTSEAADRTLIPATYLRVSVSKPD